MELMQTIEQRNEKIIALRLSDESLYIKDIAKKIGVSLWSIKNCLIKNNIQTPCHCKCGTLCHLDYVNGHRLEKKRSKIMKEVCARPGHKKRRSKIMKEVWKRPKYRENIIKSHKEVWKRPGQKEKQNKAAKEVWKKPGQKEKQIKAAKEVWKRPKYRENIIKSHKEVWTRPGYKEKQSKSQKEVWKKPGQKEKQSKSQKEVWKKPGQKEKQSKAAKEVWKRPGYKEKKSKSQKEVWKKLGFRKNQIKKQKETHNRPEVREKKRNKQLDNIERQLIGGLPASPCIGKNEKPAIEIMAKTLGYNFIPQYRVAGYAVDGYCKELNLAVEIDEPGHEKQKDKDAIRQKIIEDRLGCKFLRIKVTNELMSEQQLKEIIEPQLMTTTV